MRDTTTHNIIEKIYYVEELDIVIIFERKMRVMKIYDAMSMKMNHEIVCDGIIQAIECIPDWNVIAVVLSNLNLVFYDATNTVKPADKFSSVISPSFKIMRKLELPATQKCMKYIARKKVLFLAGINGAILALDLDAIFNNEI